MEQVRYAAADSYVLHGLLRSLGGLEGVAAASLRQVQRGRKARSTRADRQSEGERPQLNDVPVVPEKTAQVTIDPEITVVELPMLSISTRTLPLAGMDEMLQKYLGLPLGGREQVMRLCAGQAFRDSLDETQYSGCELRSAGGGGTTLWEGGEMCLYINTANTRPNAGRYRNWFWREPRGDLSGSVCMCWFPGRGARLTDPSLQALLQGTTSLLFARKQPSRPYRFCGRLEAIAIASPQELETRAPVLTRRARALQSWQTKDNVAPHIIFRLVDSETLFDGTAAAGTSLVDDIFGASGGISATRPAQYMIAESQRTTTSEPR
jgi:hypothetical protein